MRQRGKRLRRPLPPQLLHFVEQFDFRPQRRQIALLFATRFTAANLIAPTHYSQMLWAVGLGALFFEEYPGPLALLGMAVIGASGLLTLLRENVRLGKVRWNPFRNRL